MTKTSEKGGLVDASRLGLRPHLNPLIPSAALKLAVERREARLGHFVAPGNPDIALGAGAELLGRELLR